MDYKVLGQEATSTDPLIEDLLQLPDSNGLLAPLREPKPVQQLVIESSEAIATSDGIFQLQEQALQLVQKRLQSFATAPDFGVKMQMAFGKGIDVSSLRQAWSSRDFSAIPKIEVRAEAEINGANGAFAGATNTIYLSSEFLSQNADNPEVIVPILLEEIGHSVDWQFNEVDSPGDEGRIFSALVYGQALSKEQLQELKVQDDTATITIDNRVVQIEQAVVSGDGGKGGTTETIALDPGLNLVKFNWENYGVPDEFQILHEGKRIAGNVGLQSGGGSGEIIVLNKNFGGVSVSALANSTELVVKVTAPLEGTAWNFNVETLPFEININGLLGDVVQVDLAKEFLKRGISLKDAGLNPNSFGLIANSNIRGKVAEIDDWQKELETGKFYFVPTVTGTPLQFGQGRKDDGLGESTLTITNGNIKIPIKFNITNGFSTGAPLQGPLITDNTVTFGTKKLDVYRQEQRLAYLGFPQRSGGKLNINGQNDGNELSWAINLFDAVIQDKSKVTPVQSLSKEAKNFINASNAPQWNELIVGTIQGVDIKDGNAQTERWATNWAFRTLQNARTAFGQNLTLNGASLKPGGAPGSPHVSHGAGRDLDIDTPPKEAYNEGRNFFLETRINNIWYVAAPNNQIIVRNPDGTYQAADPIAPTPGNPGNLVNAVRGNQAFNNRLILSQIRDFLVDNTAIGYTSANVQAQIQAFTNTGLITRVLHNDPRLWSSLNGQTGLIQYKPSHNGHIHYDIAIPTAITNFTTFNLQSSNIEAFSPELYLAKNTSTTNSPLTNVLISSVNNDLSNAIELSQLEGNVNFTGSISSANPDVYYRFTLGNPIDEDEVYFFTLRDFSLLLNGLTADVDLELIQDFNGDNIRQDYEVVASSEEIANSNETIGLTDLSSNVYYVRVFQKSGDTNYNLSLTVPMLPVPPDNASNTPSNAQDLGTLSGSLTRTDFMGEVDPDDYYRFNITTVSDFSLEVNGLDQGDLFVTLGQDTNNDGVIDFDETIAISDAEANEAENININGLAAGTYYAWLSRNSGNTDYNLNLSATPAIIPPDQAGSAPSTAFDIGSLSSISSFSDFVGNVDPEDFYRFSLTNVSGLKIELNGLSTDADLEIAQDTNNDGEIDSDEIISTSDLSGTDAEVIDISALAAGTYFVRVHQYEGDINYNLSLTPTNPVGSDLLLTRTDSTGAVSLGQQYTYALTVTNNGPSTATDVVLTEKLLGVSFDSVTTTVPPQPLEDVLKVRVAVKKLSGCKLQIRSPQHRESHE